MPARPDSMHVVFGGRYVEGGARAAHVPATATAQRLTAQDVAAFDRALAGLVADLRAEQADGLLVALGTPHEGTRH